MPVTQDKITEKREERLQLAGEANSLLDRADQAKEKGEATRAKELLAEFDRIHEEQITELDAWIERAEKQRDAQARIEEDDATLRETAAGQQESRSQDPERDEPDEPELDPAKAEAKAKRQAEARRQARLAYYRNGFAALGPEQRQLIQTQRADEDALPAEIRAQSVGSDTAFGLLVPQGEMQPMNEALLEFGAALRAPFTVISTSHGRKIPIPTNNDTGNTGRWLGENRAAAETNMTVGEVNLDAYILTSDYILVPFTLLQDVDFDVEAFILRKAGERNGRSLSAALTNGNGVSKPEGIVVGSTLGRIGPSGQTSTAKWDDLHELEHSVDVAYRNQGARYMLHDSSLLVLKKLKDGLGRPLWDPGSTLTGDPNRLNGYEYVVNNDMPAMAASAKSILFGAMRNYYRREVTSRVVLRLSERFAENGQVAFLVFERHDGKLVDAGTNPIKFYQNAAS